MGRLIVASMVKDEAGRYWRSALDCWGDFADLIIVLDDGSEDRTKEIAEEHGCDVLTLPDARDAWGHESAHRAALFAYAWGAAEEGDVILWLDADMVPAKNPRKFLEQEGFDQFAFILYDLWGRNVNGRYLYRYDPPYWQANDMARIWAIRKKEPFEAKWDVRGIHSGHIPSNWFSSARKTLYVPATHGLLHFGYFTLEDRKEHYERYMDVKRILRPIELAHAQTIMDTEPRLCALVMDLDYELGRAT